MTSNQIYMTQALKKAWQYQLRTYPNPAVGALILCNYNQDEDLHKRPLSKLIRDISNELGLI